MTLDTRLVGQNMILTGKNMRNVLFSNYYKFKKIREITICSFEKSISLLDVFFLRKKNRLIIPWDNRFNIPTFWQVGEVEHKT